VTRREVQKGGKKEEVEKGKKELHPALLSLSLTSFTNLQAERKERKREKASFS